VLSRAMTPKRKGRRWLTALATLSLLTGTLVFSSTATGLTQSEFELDKNATNDLTTFHQGTLKGQINSTTATTFNVCQLLADPDPGDIILVDAEQMEINSVSLLPGNGSDKLGGCSFSNPADVALNVKVYDVDRGVNGTTAATHPGAADVTLMVTGAAAGDDWDDVYDSVQDDLAQDPPITENHTCADLGGVACLFVADGGGDSGIAEATIFIQGGSKDDLNINPLPGEPGTGWKWTAGSVPPSDEILDAFAIKYDTGTRQLLFFGADRWSTNGAKDMGFWFFHDTVGLNEDGSFDGNHTRPSDGGTPGDPTDDTRGDILLLSTFTQGGAVTTIRVFEWVGDCDVAIEPACVNNTLLDIGAFGDCVPGDPADDGCNTVSNTTVPSPWPYQGAGSTDVADVIYTGGLAEGGIDLTALGLEGCFSSFMAETRSSPEAGAQLKDFALGSFEVCAATITTDASDDTISLGESITDSATVNVTGGGPAPTGFVDFYVCGPSAGITSCDATGTFVSSEDLAGATGTPPDFTVTSDSFTPTEPGDYCFYAEYPAGQDANYPDGAFLTDFTDECFTVELFQPAQTTAQTWSVFDTMTITVAGGGDLLGTAHFALHRTADCSDVAFFTEDVAVSGPSGTSVSTTPTALTTFTADEPTLYWNVSYDSDNPSHADIPASCTENSSLDINN
jgi:hypothetical protein